MAKTPEPLKKSSISIDTWNLLCACVLLFTQDSRARKALRRQKVQTWGVELIQCSLKFIAVSE